MNFEAKGLSCVSLTIEISPTMIEIKIEPEQVASNDRSVVHAIVNEQAQFNREGHFPIFFREVIFDNRKEMPTQVS